MHFREKGRQTAEGSDNVYVQKLCYAIRKLAHLRFMANEKIAKGI